MNDKQTEGAPNGLTAIALAIGAVFAIDFIAQLVVERYGLMPIIIFCAMLLIIAGCIYMRPRK